MVDNERVGVVFDVDGVLIDSAEAHFESWYMLGRERGTEVTRDQFAATFGRQNRDVIPGLFGAVSPEQLAAMSDRKELLYRDIVRDDPPIVAGAIDLVHGLHDAGVLLGVGSSGPPPNVELVLDAMDVTPLMAAVIHGDHVSRGKPDPQVFRLAFDAMGLPPERCVVIEDAPAGVMAARSAGAKAVAVLIYHPKNAFDKPDLFVERLADLSVEQLIRLAQPR